MPGAGDAVGVLHLMELPRNLRRRHPQEMKSLSALVDRELARLDMLARLAPLRTHLPKVSCCDTVSCPNLALPCNVEARLPPNHSRPLRRQQARHDRTFAWLTVSARLPAVAQMTYPADASAWMMPSLPPATEPWLHAAIPAELLHLFIKGRAFGWLAWQD